MGMPRELNKGLKVRRRGEGQRQRRKILYSPELSQLFSLTSER